MIPYIDGPFDEQGYLVFSKQELHKLYKGTPWAKYAPPDEVKMNTYSIHTKDTMYTIQAAYFTASEMGVLFFNEEAEGIGFVPSYALELVRLEIKIPATVENVREVYDNR